MFKTIQECRLDLVSYSVANVPTKDVTWLGSDSAASKETMLPVEDSSLDFMPCSAARVSFGNEDKTGQDTEKDVKLMKYLAEHKHMTPFEYQHATFLVEVPLFIRSQIHRHRTFSYNEISRRYTDEDIEFWVPDKWRGQSKSNRQASSDEAVTLLSTDGWEGDPFEDYKTMIAGGGRDPGVLDLYNAMLESGVAREQARAVLPQSLLTKFFMGGTLRNWAHFIELRRDEHAQYEVQVVATRIAEELRKLWPTSCTALGI